MTGHQPPPITLTERARRIDLIRQIATTLGFRGRVEYRHDYGSAGPAQLRIGRKIVDDEMRVFAQAFNWNEDPREFSVAAIIAHECGHQVFHRHQWVRWWFGSEISESQEEVIASLIGALLVKTAADHDALQDKALGDALNAGTNPAEAVAFINGINKVLEVVLC